MASPSSSSADMIARIRSLVERELADKGLTDADVEQHAPDFVQDLCEILAAPAPDADATARRIWVAGEAVQDALSGLTPDMTAYLELQDAHAHILDAYKTYTHDDLPPTPVRHCATCGLVLFADGDVCDDCG